MIPYGKQFIDDDDIQAVVNVLRGDWLTQGPTVARFEAALQEYTGAKYAVAVANGTAALHLACLAIDLKAGDEGITSPITFAASANCMLYCGATPRFADIEASTWNISPVEIEKQINEKTKVLVPVDFAGLPCDLETIRNLANKHRLIVIEDACHALGAKFKGKRIGGCGTSDMTVLSFHPVKHITTGEGGAILTDDAVLAKRLKQLRHHGINKDPDELEENHGPWYHEIQILGYNARLTDFQCALGLSQMNKLDRFLARRKQIAIRYRESFAKIQGIVMQRVPDGYDHAYHLFIIHLDSARYDRRAVFAFFQKNGVNPQVHYIPVHLHPLYRKRIGTKLGDFPVAEGYYGGAISLPIYPSLDSSDLEKVVDILHQAKPKNVRE